MKKIAVFCCILMIHMIFFSAGNTAAAELINGCPTAIFVFGDSTADNGNNNDLPGDPPKSNHQPYGVYLPGRRPTGRFSNGFIGVDYIAQAFGYPMSPPSFRSIKDQFLTRYKKGVNFASAGAGILDATGKDVITMDQQIKEFGDVVGNITTQLGNRRPLVDDFFSKALFLFSVGSNDLFYAFITSSPMNDNAQRDRIINPIINKFNHQLMMLYRLGARKFGVTGTGQIGCVPALRNPSTPNVCNENLNAISLRFKDATHSILDDLSSDLDGFKYSFGDSYLLGSTITSDPSHFGLSDMNTPCCSSLGSLFLCNPNSDYCPGPDEHYFWDGFHPTQAAYKLIADILVHGSQDINMPIDLFELAHS